MRVVVTGATSFIGAVTTGQLLRKGHEVCAVARPGSRNMKNLWDHVPEKLRKSLTVAEVAMEEIEKVSRQVGRQTPGSTPAGRAREVITVL